MLFINQMQVIIYITNDLGRIKSVKLEDLQLCKIPRLTHKSNTPRTLGGDHVGHLIVDEFRGLPKIYMIGVDFTKLVFNNY